ARTLEGSPVYTVWARSPQSGWGVGLGIPEAAVETPLRRSLLTVGAGGLACAIVALGLALLVGRRITEPIVALASAAKAFGQQDVAVPTRASTVQEVEDVRRAFADAAALVQERAGEAAEANQIGRASGREGVGE